MTFGGKGLIGLYCLVVTSVRHAKNCPYCTYNPGRIVGNVDVCTAPPTASEFEKFNFYIDYKCKSRCIDNVPHLYKNTGEVIRNHHRLHLNLAVNKIRGLKQGAFSHVSKASAICLDRNKIMNIEAGAFKGMYNMKHLVLSSNKIKNIHPAMWQGAENLQTLNLTSNKIKMIQNGSFSTLPNLINISLQINKISILSSQAFENLGKLEQIELQNNKIKTISAETFASLPRISKVYLQYNKLSKLRLQMFSKAHFLSELNLEHNNFQIPNDFLHFSHGGVSFLHLGCNNFPKIIFNLMKNMSNLQGIMIKDIKITKIPNGTFSSLDSLLTLGLSYNNISEISGSMWQGLHRLEVLDLGCNKISFIPYAAFWHLHNCRIIDLYRNRITHFVPGALAGLFPLNAMDIRKNNIHILSPALFDSNLHSIYQKQRTTIAIQFPEWGRQRCSYQECFCKSSRNSCLCKMQNVTHDPSKIMLSIKPWAPVCCKDKDSGNSRSTPKKRPKEYVYNITCIRNAPDKEKPVPTYTGIVNMSVLGSQYPVSHTTTDIKYSQTSTNDGHEFDEKNDPAYTEDNTEKHVDEANEKQWNRMVTRYIMISLAGFFTIATIIGVIIARVVYRKMALEHAENQVPT